MREDKVLPAEAAIIMGTSPQFIRVGMQTGQLPIGTVLKTSSIWTYNIQKDQLARYIGRDITKELEEIRKIKK